MIKIDICPVCGYDELLEPAYIMDKYPSYEICPSCGFQYGYSDDNDGYSFEDYRKKWIEEGCNWYSKARKQPDNWNPKDQLKRIVT
ncbi:hypothetical protein [Cytobacillus sp. IB215665]|uniref:hypothetical protein n=1 Tax=Cytobacillus sp. IB215665 TaxID=3097357 RepID=UPI002A0EE93C|nr:hypothetical protein [Cytobacillus sp. IB215665]MDX8366579.1 hypothetical protein [Cytobacillus sp. IB215665]